MHTNCTAAVNRKYEYLLHSGFMVLYGYAVLATAAPCQDAAATTAFLNDGRDRWSLLFSQQTITHLTHYQW
jgi:hypothetical protein